MSMYDKNHYNIVISFQLIKINEKKVTKMNLFAHIEYLNLIYYKICVKLHYIRL